MPFILIDFNSNLLFPPEILPPPLNTKYSFVQFFKSVTSKISFLEIVILSSKFFISDTFFSFIFGNIFFLLD